MTDTAGYRPLYRQVYDILVHKIAEGVWRAGEALPSESALARELGVSQGTIRKVLDTLTSEQLLDRRQGKGTFIAENTQERSLFRFFRLARPGGQRLAPANGGETATVRAARPVEQTRLELTRGERVVEINRVRLIDGRPAISEVIVLPWALFPGIEKRNPLPNTLYSLYQAAYGVNIIATREELRADLANERDEAGLGAPQGSPLLVIDRIALSLHERKVEWRLSRVWAQDIVYAVMLG